MQENLLDRFTGSEAGEPIMAFFMTRYESPQWLCTAEPEDRIASQLKNTFASQEKGSKTQHKSKKHDLKAHWQLVVSLLGKLKKIWYFATYFKSPWQQKTELFWKVFKISAHFFAFLLHTVYKYICLVSLTTGHVFLPQFPGLCFNHPQIYSLPLSFTNLMSIS